MLVSLKWLSDYVDLPDDLDAGELAHRLTTASAEVEGIRRIGATWDRELVTVGAVVAVDLHPNADRLRLATVDYGSDERQQVVCGAPNVEAGQRVAFGREGATLIDPQSNEPATLKRAKIRGVESAGMVLSERELGISDEHEGILVLPEDAPVGLPLVDYLGDAVLDVHTWPNRADTMSMLGIAREVAAILGSEWHAPNSAYAEDGPAVSEAVAVAIEDPGLCARYVATVVEGVTVGPSPRWMQERLRAAGQRPINNVVDITNYVMLELGQPLHAFDLAAVQGAVVVRTAREGERLTTLDGEDRTLSAETLLITDESGAIGLAGVMGGASTEVGEGTTSILLEAARFDPSTIRRSSSRLGLRSEASSRFERGLSSELAMHAARRATKFFVELCGGTARRGAIDVYPRQHHAPQVTVSRRRLDTVIGFHVPDDEVEGNLRALGFEVEHVNREDADRFVVQPPWWRTDVSIPDDVAEEIVRIAGYDRLVATTLAGRIPRHERRPLSELRERLRDALVEAGLYEMISYSLTTEDVLRRVMPAEELAAPRPLRVANPLSSDREVLRPTLRHALLEAVERNVRAGAPDVALFEMARVYLPNQAAGDQLPEERDMIVAAISGVEMDRWGQPSGRPLDFFDAKGVLEQALAELGVTLDFVADEEFAMLPARTARLRAAGEAVGVLAEVHPETLAQFDIEQAVALFELDLARLLPHVPERRQASAVPRYPAVEQDLAVVVDGGVEAGALQAVVEGSPLVAEARVFDVYHGEQLPKGKKSVALSIRYQAADRTLTTDDANAEQAKLLERLKREFGAEQRG